MILVRRAFRYFVVAVDTFCVHGVTDVVFVYKDDTRFYIAKNTQIMTVSCFVREEFDVLFINRADEQQLVLSALALTVEFLVLNSLEYCAVRVMSQDADLDRMRRSRAASRSARSRRDLDQSCARGFFAMSARPRRARRGRRRVRGVRGATLCVVYGTERRTSRPGTVFVVARHCVIYSK